MTVALNTDQIKIPDSSEILSPNPPDKLSSTLVEYLRAALSSENPGMQSLHDRVVHLPFFKRLAAKNISPKEFLLKLVNDSAIYSKFETVIKTNKSYNGILRNVLFRHEAIENDISFFLTQFNLSRPAATFETKQYLHFIEKMTREEDENLFPILLYVQYTRLFAGKIISDATAIWLAKNVPNWDTFPTQKRGLSYWHFKGLTLKELDLEKRKFLDAINKYGNKTKTVEKAEELARETFSHIISSVESCTAIPKRTMWIFSNS